MKKIFYSSNRLVLERPLGGQKSTEKPLVIHAPFPIISLEWDSNPQSYNPEIKAINMDQPESTRRRGKYHFSARLQFNLFGFY